MRNRKMAIFVLVVVFFVCASKPIYAAEVNRVTLGTATVGGNYYVIGSALAQIWNQNIPNIEVTAEVTNGSGANVGLVQKGDIQVALTSDPTAYNGYYGLGWANGVKYDRIRTMAGIMPSGLEIFAPEKSDIRTIQDYNGKTITTGPSSGGGSIMMLDLFPTLGIKPGKKQDLGWGDAIGNLVDGLIDCGLDFASFPHAARTELVANMPIRWIELKPEERKLMCEKFPYYYEGVMPADTYQYLPAEGYKTVMSANILFCDKDVDDEIVYQLVKTMFAKLDDLTISTNAFKYVTEKNIETVSVPLHPGAIRYYQEKGFTIPDKLLSPEYVKQ